MLSNHYQNSWQHTSFLGQRRLKNLFLFWQICMKNLFRKYFSALLTMTHSVERIPQATISFIWVGSIYYSIELQVPKYEYIAENFLFFSCKALKPAPKKFNQEVTFFSVRNSTEAFCSSTVWIKMIGNHHSSHLNNLLKSY